MATATQSPAIDAASIAAVPGLNPEMHAAIESAVRTGAELMRLRVLRIVSAQLDSVTALRIAELVMQVKV